MAKINLFVLKASIHPTSYTPFATFTTSIICTSYMNIQRKKKKKILYSSCFVQSFSKVNKMPLNRNEKTNFLFRQNMCVVQVVLFRNWSENSYTICEGTHINTQYIPNTMNSAVSHDKILCSMHSLMNGYNKYKRTLKKWILKVHTYTHTVEEYIRITYIVQWYNEIKNARFTF